VVFLNSQPMECDYRSSRAGLFHQLLCPQFGQGVPATKSG
jgi:hypothetical protein